VGNIVLEFYKNEGLRHYCKMLKAYFYASALGCMDVKILTPLV